MAPNPQSTSSINLLDYLRSATSVDYDSLDLKVAKTLGNFADCTSNQWEAYSQLSNPENAALLAEAIRFTRRLKADFQQITFEELAVEVGMIMLALRAIPLISGAIHVMCNPLYSWNSDQVYHTGHRFHKLCSILQPSFDCSRLVMKVPATWEGLQACARLKREDIKTLATTLFTMEQVILAGEAGCISISPFAHELRAHLEPSYNDPEPILPLFLQAQQYYLQHRIPTKVKACAFMTVDEIITMAGVDAITLPAEVLEELASISDLQDSLEKRSVFFSAAKEITGHPERLIQQSYIHDKAKFDRAYLTNGRGKSKTEDSIAVFCGFQVQAEALVAKSALQSKL